LGEFVDLHGAPPWEATLAIELNGEMMRKLPFGNLRWSTNRELSRERLDFDLVFGVALFYYQGSSGLDVRCPQGTAMATIKKGGH
jgi:hypothetical protein